MVLGGSTIGNDGGGGPGIGENRLRKGGRVRTGKYADVEEVDVEADG